MITVNRNAVRATTAPTTGGTQSNELQAKIKSVTTSTTIGAVFLYDTSQDSDSGKWRKKCKGLSWYDEASSATRSARSEFPAMALIVADNVSDTETLTIYDLDDPAMPLWMQFTVTTQASPYHDFWRDGRDVTSIFALNGRLYFGTTESADAQVGLKVVDFVEDRLSNRNIGSSNEWNGYFADNVANRNSATKVFLGNTFTAIVHQTVNDVSATVLEGAELDSMGLPIPTVAVATAGGISWIHPNGDVFDSTAYGAFDKIVAHGRDEWIGSQFAGTEVIRIFKTAYADGHTEHASREYAATSTPAILDGDPVIAATSDGFSAGTANGLTLVKDNPNNSAESAVAYVTSDYTTGWMCGDIRLAALTKTNLMADRSVKGNTLTENGSLNASEVASGAEQYAIYGFSSSNYLSRANDADFDFGTGDFSIMFWVKWTADGSNTQVFLDRGAASTSRILLYDPSSNGNIQLYVYNPSVTLANITTSNAFDDGNWHQVVALRRSSKLCVYVDGVDAQTTHVASTHDLDSGTATLNVGVNYAQGSALNGSLALLRLSATAPTPQQIKEIYEAEKPLFQANAKCTLDGNSINDLAYDKSSGLLYVCNSGGSNIMRGLEYIEELTRNGTYGFASGGTIDLMTAAGGVHAASRTTLGVGANLPALDVRAELNEGEDKLPDDGKLHFEGVTTNATPTVIAFIPISKGDTYYINSKATGFRYGQPDTSWRLCGEIKQQFTRTYHGNVVAESESFKLSEGEQASMDIELVTTTAQASRKART